MNQCTRSLNVYAFSAPHIHEIYVYVKETRGRTISEMDRCSTMFMIRIRFKIAFSTVEMPKYSHNDYSDIETNGACAEWFFLAKIHDVCVCVFFLLLF